MKKIVLLVLPIMLFLVLPTGVQANSSCGGVHDDIASSIAQLKSTMTTPSS